MEIINGLPKEKIKEKFSIALGYFDGVHVGHQAIINKAIDSKGSSAVLTFSRHKSENKNGENIPPMLMTMPEKIEYFESIGVDYLFIMDFSKEFMTLSPEEFVKILLCKLNVESFSIGFNYHFGKNGSGNAETLKKLGEKYNFKVNVTNEVKIDDIVVSSTYIRKLIVDGEVDKARKFLGHNYCISGDVFKGKGLSKKTRVKTANIFPPKGKVIPRKGVYAVKTLIDGKYYGGVANIGVNPMFENKEVRLEVNLFEFQDNIYGENIKTEFIKLIREERKFETKEALFCEIRKNIEQAKEILKSE